MEHDIGLVLGILTGLGAGLLLVSLLFRKKVLDMTFDERQERARGKAFQYGFFVLAACVVLYGAADTFLGRWCDTLTGAVLCVCVALTVFAAVCIWKDAYLSLKERPGKVMTLFAGLAAMNLGLGGILTSSGGLVEDGVLTFRACNLAAGVLLLAVMAIYGVKLLRERKREEE